MIRDDAVGRRKAIHSLELGKPEWCQSFVELGTEGPGYSPGHAMGDLNLRTDCKVLTLLKQSRFALWYSPISGPVTKSTRQSTR